MIRPGCDNYPGYAAYTTTGTEFLVRKYDDLFRKQVIELLQECDNAYKPELVR